MFDFLKKVVETVVHVVKNVIKYLDKVGSNDNHVDKGVQQNNGGPPTGGGNPGNPGHDDEHHNHEEHDDHKRPGSHNKGPSKNNERPAKRGELQREGLPHAPRALPNYVSELNARRELNPPGLTMADVRARAKGNDIARETILLVDTGEKPPSRELHHTMQGMSSYNQRPELRGEAHGIVDNLVGLRGETRQRRSKSEPEMNAVGGVRFGGERGSRPPIGEMGSRQTKDGLQGRTGISGGGPGGRIPEGSQIAVEQILAYQSVTPDTPVEKTEYTLNLLQEMAQDYPKDNLNDPETREAFKAKWGVYPEYVTWFAEDHVVTLKEILEMHLVAEGATVALNAEVIRLTANRFFSRINSASGAASLAKAAGVDLSDVTAEFLTQYYDSKDPNDIEKQALSEYIITVLLSYDTSFYNSRPQSEPGLPRAADSWKNLIQDPTKLAFGAAVEKYAGKLVNPSTWIDLKAPEGDTEFIAGQRLTDYGSQDLFKPTFTKENLITKLSDVKLGAPRIEDTETGFAIFMSYCQSKVYKYIYKTLADNANLKVEEITAREITENTGCGSLS